MESDVLDILDQLGYDGALSDENSLLAACEEGFSSSEYMNLLRYLLTRLINITETPADESLIKDDPDSCLLNLNRLLREFCCPYDDIISGLINKDLKNAKNYLKILLFLGSELQAAEMVSNKAADDEKMELDDSLQDLRLICKTLNLPDPKQQEAIKDIISVIEKKVCVLLKPLPETYVLNPAFKGSLDVAKWNKLEKINDVLSADYESRRRMLIKRLDVTVQSFSWSDRAKVKIDGMAKAYQLKRYSLSLKSSVTLSHLLAARVDIYNLMKTSSGSCREKTTCAVNKILMGAVPDRGGRPSEIQAPLPEMPTWQKRSDGGTRGGGGGRGGRFDRGRGGGSWGGSGGQCKQGNWKSGRRGHYYQ